MAVQCEITYQGKPVTDKGEATKAVETLFGKGWDWDTELGGGCWIVELPGEPEAEYLSDEATDADNDWYHASHDFSKDGYELYTHGL